MPKFRLEDLKIWQEACAFGDELDEIAEELERRRERYSEQLRGGGYSDIAEGSGSAPDRGFKNFLNIARRSAYENVNVALFIARRGMIGATNRDHLVERLRVLYAKIAAFAASLG